jgi:hypothetical protein
MRRVLTIDQDAQVIIQLANTERPPLHLLVGKDMINLYRNNAAKMAQEIEAWLPVATSTDHDHRVIASTVV